MLSEEEKKAIERLEEQLNFWKKQNIKNSDCEIILNLITKLQKQCEEKDKQIDLMAEHIVSSAIVDDTVCAIKCDCESDILEDCSHEKMLNCTKQYFETKSKGE